MVIHVVTHESYDNVLVGTRRRNVSSRCLKTASDSADVTLRGRSFQTVAPEAGNARLPIVKRWTGRTSRRWEVEDRSRRLDVMSATRVKDDRIGRTEKCRGWILIRHNCITASLKEIHSGTRSQCRSIIVSEMTNSLSGHYRGLKGQLKRWVFKRFL